MGEGLPDQSHVDRHGNFLNSDGTLAFISGQFFLEKILENEHCFICGVLPKKVKFNDEHIIPQWLLTYADIWKDSITLPNGARINYGRYKVKCCMGCNALLGRVFEARVAEVLRGGFSCVDEFVKTNDGFDLIFVWLALLHLKTSMLDFRLDYNVDKRLPQFAIGSTLNFRLLHHVLCLCRSYVLGHKIEDKVYGSMFVFEVEENNPSKKKFDFVDLHFPQTVLLRIGDVAIISCFNDSGALAIIAENHLERIRTWGRPLNELQLKETFAYLSCASLQMRKPEFVTVFDRVSRQIEVICNRPNEIEIDDYNPKLMGALMLSLVRENVPNMTIEGKRGKAAAELIATGTVTFYSGSIFRTDERQTKLYKEMLHEVDDVLSRCSSELSTGFQ